MSYISHVTSIEYRDGYVFRVTFDDGAAGDVDFSDCLDLGPVFSPLRDLSYFRQARIEGGTIAWPNGADIAPETLYDKVEVAESAHAPVARDKPATRLRWLDWSIMDGAGARGPSLQPKPGLYGLWLLILHYIAANLNTNHRSCPHPRMFIRSGLRKKNVWYAADVEMALFAYASSVK